MRTVRLVDPSPARLAAVFAPLERAAVAALRWEGLARARCRIVRVADVSYVGQSHEIRMPFSRRLVADFHARHRRLYGYADPARPVVVVNVRVMGIGRVERVRERRAAVAGGVASRPWQLQWAGRTVRACVWDRQMLAPETVVEGPAVIAEYSGTTVVPPGWRARVDPTRHLVVSHGD